MHRRGRQRDKYGRFLPWESVNLNDEIEEVKMPFEDASPIFPTKYFSREQPLDTSGLQPFSKNFANFLGSSTPNPPVVNNPVPNVPY